MRKLSETMDLTTVAHSGTPLPELLKASTQHALENLRALAADNDPSERARTQTVDTNTDR